MLVKLYDLPDDSELFAALRREGTIIRRPQPSERHLVTDWVRSNFHELWASECDICLCAKPITCFIAVRGTEMLGFGCYDGSARGFFGPTGVAPQRRGRGVGKALLLSCLRAMWDAGYGYAIIGGVGPAEFYRKCVGATVIEGSEKGIFHNLLWAGSPLATAASRATT